MTPRCHHCGGALEFFEGEAYCDRCWSYAPATLPDDPDDLVWIEDDPPPPDDAWLREDDAGRGTW
jgi:hypothetical protein